MEQAIEKYRQALVWNLTMRILTITWLGLKIQREAPGAVEAFQTALRLRPKWAEAHFGLGATYYTLQNQAASFRELRLALDLDPKHAGAHYFLAMILAERNELPEATTELNRVLQLQPSHWEARHRLGLLICKTIILPQLSRNFGDVSRSDHPLSRPTTIWDWLWGNWATLTSR